MPLPLPMRGLRQSVADIFLLNRTGGIMVSTPPEAPLISTLVLLDGNITNHIDTSRFRHAEQVGTDPNALLGDHRARLEGRLASLSAASGWAAPLHYLPAGLLPGLPWFIGWWQLDFSTVYLLSIVIPVAVGFALRRTPSLLLRG